MARISSPNTANASSSSAFANLSNFDFDALPLPAKGRRTLKEILHQTDGSEPHLPWDGDRFFNHAKKQVDPKYTLTDKLWPYLQDYAEKHRAKGNGFGFGLVTPDSVTRTLSARYYKDGSEILVYQGEEQKPTPPDTTGMRTADGLPGHVQDSGVGYTGIQTVWKFCCC